MASSSWVVNCNSSSCILQLSEGVVPVSLDTEAAAEVQRELTVFARRIRASSAQLHPDLPFVAYSVLSQLDATGGCRAVDLVRLYRLDKSTVSRQVTDLEDRGLVSREAAPAGGRGQRLRVTPAGARLLDEADARPRVHLHRRPPPPGARRLDEAPAGQRAPLHRRLAAWDPADVETFARLLRRYNAD